MELREEVRIYAVIRDDLHWSPTKYMDLAIDGYMKLAEMCSLHPEFMEDYSSDLQPKLVLRAKNSSIMKKSLDALIATDLHFICITSEDEILALFIAPSVRSTLPKEVASLQLFSEPRNPISSNDEEKKTSSENNYMELFFRSELPAPLGKMMAQAGHAVWAACGIFENTFTPTAVSVTPVDEQEWKKLMETENNENTGLIIDAGRTIFTEPTPTFLWKRNANKIEHMAGQWI